MRLLAIIWILFLQTSPNCKEFIYKEDEEERDREYKLFLKVFAVGLVRFLVGREPLLKGKAQYSWPPVLYRNKLECFPLCQSLPLPLPPLALQSEAKIIYMTNVNFVTPNAGAKQELLINKPRNLFRLPL